MYAFLCKPVPIALPSGNTAIRARDCRIVKLTAYNERENKIELEILNAPPIVINEDIKNKDELD